MACSNCRRRRTKFGNVVNMFANVVEINQLGKGLTGFLDNYTGSAVAYGFARIYGSFTGATVQVRRSSDNATTDVTPNANGDLDLTSIVSAGGTLSAWVGANDAYVRTWYDQSGNGNNAVQSTISNQSRFITAGALTTVNGKAATDTTVRLWYEFNTSLASIGNFAAYWVTKSASTINGDSVVFGDTVSGITYLGDDTDGNGNPMGRANGTFFVTNGLGNTTASGTEINHHIASMDRSGSNSNGGHNNSFGSVISTSSAAFNIDKMGYVNSFPSYNFRGNFQHSVFFLSSKASDQAAIVTAINSYYGAY